MFIQALDADASDFSVFSNRCAARLKLGQNGLALTDAISCTVLAPTWAKGYFRLGWCRFKTLSTHTALNKNCKTFTRLFPVCSRFPRLSPRFPRLSRLSPHLRSSTSSASASADLLASRPLSSRSPSPLPHRQLTPAASVRLCFSARGRSALSALDRHAEAADALLKSLRRPPARVAPSESCDPGRAARVVRSEPRRPSRAIRVAPSESCYPSRAIGIAADSFALRGQWATHARTRARAHTHTHIHTRTNAHTHAHTQPGPGRPDGAGGPQGVPSESSIRVDFRVNFLSPRFGSDSSSFRVTGPIPLAWGGDGARFVDSDA